MQQLKKLIPASIKRGLKRRFLREQPAYLPRPTAACSARFIGNDYGGAPVCVDRLREGSIVYSVGVGEDIVFDLQLIEQYGVEIFAFDPTPKSIHWVQQQDTPPQFHFYGYGLGAQDGDLTLYLPENPEHVSLSVVQKHDEAEAITLPMKRLQTIMAELGHTHIDLLKLDIEGAEYDVVDDIVRSDVPIAQLSIEFHHRFPGLDIRQTKEAVARLQAHGYAVAYAHEAPNTIVFMNA